MLSKHFSTFRRLVLLKRCASVNVSRRQYNDNQHQQFQAIDNEILYEGHRPTNSFQKSLLAVGSALAGVTNPLRSDMVAALGESLFPEPALRNIQLQMLNDPTGQRILKEKPIIDGNILNLDKLLTLPEDTFGYTYASFMRKHEITSDTRDPVHYVDNTELAYIIKRYRQIHDFAHVFLDLSINVPEEVIIKWFEWAHFGLPMNAVSALFGPLATSAEEKATITKYIPWALYNGYNSKSFMNVYFEEELETNFMELKKRLNLIDKPNL